MVYVVSYDVAGDKRRTKVARALSDVGTRVQYSVFEADVSREMLAACLDKIEKIIDEKEDSVRVYGLCERCAKTVRTKGRSTTSGWPDAIIV